MTAMNFKTLYPRGQCVFWFTFSWLALIGCSIGQVSSSEKRGTSEQDFSLKVQVEETRIDVVALDKNGRQVKDLNADDFELYQDGKRQEIKSCTYVAEDQRSSASKILGKASRDSPLVSTPLMPREKVQRTIAFVIDTASMSQDESSTSFENFSHARMAVRKFIESQMEPGDLVTIMKTSGGIGALQRFSTDKMGLLSTIDHMECGRDCLGNVKINLLSRVDYLVLKKEGPIVDPSLSGNDLVKLHANLIDPRYLMQPPESEDPWRQLGALRYCIRALRDMPGRKTLLFISPRVTFTSGNVPFKLIEQMFNQLADEALRAGVVIYAMDVNGLTVGSRNPYGRKYVPWPKKTGGIIVENTNFFLQGIGPVEEALKGYYLLSYVPPAGTFDNNRRGLYHRIRIKVRRPGSVSHYRDGFFGIADRPDFISEVGMNTLQQAIYSPFLYNDLTLAMASGYAYTPESGYFLSLRMHVDGKNLVFKEEEDGRHSFSLELETLTSDAGNMVEDSQNMKYGFRVKAEELPYIKQYGIDLSMYLPVKKPGAYYLRSAIKDRNSGKIGSAYQFLEIPDLKKRKLALSGLFTYKHEEEVMSILSGKIQDSDASSSPIQKWEIVDRSSVRRVYHPGEELRYLVIVYNANVLRTPPQLEAQTVIFRDGKEIYKGNVENVNLQGMTDLGRVPIRGEMAIGSQLEPGSYVLQVRISDAHSKGKPLMAVQAIEFEVGNGSPNESGGTSFR
jgi:VWFA-related protein